MASNLFHYSMELIYYYYWEEKTQFAFEEAIHKKWTLFAVKSGSFKYEIADESGTAMFGDIIICPPGVPFRRKVISPLTFHHFSVVWKVKGMPVTDIPKEIPIGKIRISDTNRLAFNYRKMHTCLEGWSESSLTKCNHYLNDSWCLYCDQKEEEVSSEISELSISDDYLIVSLDAFIRKNAFKPIKLKDLAKTLNTSSSLITQKFKLAYGITPSEFLLSLRMERAKKLLLETTLLLDEIADNCGYQNAYYFNRLFTKVMKVTPGKFRKAYKL
jgi:AraC family transcriptional regulator